MLKKIYEYANELIGREYLRSSSSLCSEIKIRIKIPLKSSTSSIQEYKYRILRKMLTFSLKVLKEEVGEISNFDAVFPTNF